MLVQNQLVQTTWNSTTKKYYEKLGYKYTNMFDTFEVRIEDLPKGSHSKIKVICDFCGKHYEKTYKDYWSQHDGGDCCVDCQGKKSFQIYNELYGPEKRIQCLKDGVKKHGVANIMELQEFRDKMRNTNMEKYGLPCMLSDPSIHDTCLSWTETARKKRSDTCLDKYGVDCVLKSKEVR